MDDQGYVDYYRQEYKDSCEGFYFVIGSQHADDHFMKRLDLFMAII